MILGVMWMKPRKLLINPLDINLQVKLSNVLEDDFTWKSMAKIKDLLENMVFDRLYILWMATDAQARWELDK